MHIGGEVRIHGRCGMAPCEHTRGERRNNVPGCTCGAGSTSATRCSRLKGGLYCSSNSIQDASCTFCEKRCEVCRTEDMVDSYGYVDTCTLCKEPYLLVSANGVQGHGTCVKDCPLGTYARARATVSSLTLVQSRECLPCDSFAAHAPWKEDQIYSDCADGYFLTAAKNVPLSVATNTSQIQPLGVPALQGPGLRSVPNSSEHLQSMPKCEVSASRCLP